MSRWASYPFLLLIGFLFFPESAGATPCPDQVLKSRADKLDKSSIQSVLRLADETLALLKDPGVAASADCAGKVFYRYWQFYFRAQRAYQKTHRQELEDPDSQKRTIATLARAGWTWESSEAGNYIWSDQSWLLKRFTLQLPLDWRAYLTQQSRQTRLTEDAILEVSWDELRQRLVYWERFLKQYPEFVLRDELKDDIENCLGLWLCGTDNTQVTEGEHLKKELRESYVRFLKENTDSSYASLLTEYVQLLTRSHFTVSAAARALLERHKIRNFQHVEPPR